MKMLWSPKAMGRLRGGSGSDGSQYKEWIGDSVRLDLNGVVAEEMWIALRAHQAPKV